MAKKSHEVNARLSCGRCSRRKSQRLHHGIVEGWAYLRDFLVFEGGVAAVGEEYDEELAVGMEPNAGEGEAGVAETVQRKIMAAGAAFGGHGPAEGACAARKLLRRGELRDGRAPQDAVMRVDSAIEQHLAKRGKIRSGAKESSVARDASDGKRVFGVHFALHQAVPKVVVDLRGHNPRPQVFGRAEHGVFQG